MTLKNEKEILKEICRAYGHDLTYTEAKDLLIELEDKLSDHSYSKYSDHPTCQDFYFEVDGNEYRLIHEDAIWNIYVEEIQQIVEECCDLKLDEVPAFIALTIDWEQTAKNAYADGYGHTFNHYDGSEYEAADYHIFRVN